MDIYFQPWVGKNYTQGLIKQKRTLIVGESHYICDGFPVLEPSFTNTTIRDEITGDCHHRNWRNLIPAIMGREFMLDPQARTKFFDSIVYAVLVQSQLKNESSRPSPSDWQACDSIFSDLLEAYKPELVLMFGLGVWRNTSALPHREVSVPELERQTKVRYYPISNAREALAYGIRHPSAYFKYEIWAPNLQKVFSLL